MYERRSNWRQREAKRSESHEAAWYEGRRGVGLMLFGVQGVRSGQFPTIGPLSEVGRARTLRRLV
jgi:hypothetical protein